MSGLAHDELRLPMPYSESLAVGPAEPHGAAWTDDEGATRKSARAQRRMIRNIVLWTIGLALLLAAVVFLSR